MVTKAEWFRRSSWTSVDETDFMARLKRSCTVFHKAQYLRIQALHLVQDADPPLHEAALGLLDLLLRDYPDRSQVAAAHEQRARSLDALGRGVDALDELRLAMEAERAHPGMQGHAYLEFAELVLTLGRKDLFSGALAVLGGRRSAEIFPVVRYRKSAAAAFLCDELGLHGESRAHATDALVAAAKTASPFRYRRSLGLVKTSDADVVQGRLRRLAGKSA
ncbi:MAG TPA: hypothetical protein VGP07_11435 [Polyangia bacterium]|jgi:hypothetical protein